MNTRMSANELSPGEALKLSTGKDYSGIIKHEGKDYHYNESGLLLLRQTKLADLLEVSPRTLERWRVEGGGPPYLKAGRRVLYAPQDVEQWLLASRKVSTSEANSTVAEISPSAKLTRETDDTGGFDDLLRARKIFEGSF